VLDVVADFTVVEAVGSDSVGVLTVGAIFGTMIVTSLLVDTTAVLVLGTVVMASFDTGEDADVTVDIDRGNDTGSWVCGFDDRSAELSGMIVADVATLTVGTSA